MGGAATAIYIPIPPTFKFAWVSADDLTIEFIPEHETLDNWSEMITVIHRHSFNDLKSFLTTYKQDCKTSGSIDSFVTNHDNYSSLKDYEIAYSYLILPHRKPPFSTTSTTTREILGLKTVYANNKAVNVLHTTQYPIDLPDDKLAALQARTESFLKSCYVTKKTPTDIDIEHPFDIVEGNAPLILGHNPLTE